MKRLSKILVISLTAAFLIPNTGCEKYFEADPVSIFANENVFENVDFTLQALLGVYQLMTRDEGYSKRLSMYYGVDTDLAMCSGDIDNGRRGIARYSANSGNSEIEKPYKNLYYGIERANIIIDNIPISPVYETGTEEEKAAMDRMLGEALTLRALHYHELIRNWGDVPYKFSSSEAGEDFSLPRTDRDEIYDKLIEDLLYAETLVPWASEFGYDERISKGAVKGLLARIALSNGGYSLRLDQTMSRRSDYLDFHEIARDQCLEIIQSGEHALNPSYEDLFRKMCSRQLDNNFVEIMFEIGLGERTSGEVGYYIGQRIDPASSYGRGDGGVLAVPSYYYSFDSLDTRRDVTVVLPEIDGNDTELQSSIISLRIGKWRRSWISPLFPGTDKFTGINWPILRYSDVLLMYAETENELNGAPSQGAKDALFAVRERAYGDNADLMPAIPDDYASFFEAIVYERACELGGESIRKYDLIRWNMLADMLADTKVNLVNMRDRETPFEDVPAQLVWRNEGTEIEYLNLNYHMDSLAIASRDSLMWPNVVDWGDAITDEFITRHAGYFEANWKELLPIHQSILDVNPNLHNEYGY